MLRFLLKRAGFVCGVSLGIVFFVFFGMRLAANSREARPSYNLVAPAREALTSTTRYVGGLFRGDWGTVTIRRSRYVRQVPVSEILGRAYPNSLGLLAISLAVSALIGIPLGILVAVQRRTGLSLGVLSLTLLGISLPSFFVAALLQTLEILWHRSTGFSLIPVGGFGWDAHLVVPTLVLGARPLAQLARVSQMSFSDILNQPYIDTARAKGLSRARIVWTHAYPNAAIAIITALGVSLRFSLGSLPVVEYFVGWPGLGAQLLDAIQNGQEDGVAGLALALGLTIMLVNLLLDVAYRLIDPRLREHRI